MLSLELLHRLESSNRIISFNVWISVLICSIRAEGALLVRVVSGGHALAYHLSEALFNVKSHLFMSALAVLLAAG